jgi:hypothetical protein
MVGLARCDGNGAAGWRGQSGKVAVNGKLRPNQPNVRFFFRRMPMPMFRFQATTRKPDGRLNKPYVHESRFEAPDISSAIQQVREHPQAPPSDTTISWLTQVNQPDYPDMVVWAMTARDGPPRTDE